MNSHTKVRTKLPSKFRLWSFEFSKSATNFRSDFNVATRNFVFGHSKFLKSAANFRNAFRNHFNSLEILRHQGFHWLQFVDMATLCTVLLT